MIPRKLFFIWLGDIYPKYVLFAINAFKKINPYYNIIFLHYTINDIYNIYYYNNIKTIYDKLLLQSILYIFNWKTSIYSNMIINNLKTYNKNLRFLQILSDIYRLELVNNIGGIYIDCDTFPIKSFDDELLYTKQFVVKKHIQYYKSILSADNYFIGNIGNNKYILDIHDTTINNIIQTYDKWWINTIFLSNKKNFFRCNSINILYNSLYNNFYIEHYCNNAWKKTYNNNIQVPYCFLDKLFNI